MKKQKPLIGKNSPIKQSVKQSIEQPEIKLISVIPSSVTFPELSKNLVKSSVKSNVSKVILCSTCKWYDIPIIGKISCREKETTKTKCKDYFQRHPILDQNILLIKQDPFVKQINDILNNNDYLLPLNDYNKELELFLVYNRKLNNNTTIRKVPKHVETRIDFQILEEVLEEIQAYRDRVTFMKMEVLTKKAKFEKIWKTAKAWLMQFSYYNNIKTKEDRTDFAGDVFERFYGYMEDMEISMKLMNIVMDNLNASYFLTKGKFDIARIVIERYQSI